MSAQQYGSNLLTLKELVLATANPGKVIELEALLAPILCIKQSDLGIHDAEETGSTFIENALIKARHAAALSQKPALADDSGLVVPALQAEPGIYSSRYAGPKASDQDNIKKLLAKLENTPDEQRGAYFYCAIVVVRSATDPTPIIATGQCYGFITHQPVGTGGFGYDPVFYIPKQECTAAQLSTATKNQISHRAQAFLSLQEQIRHG